jgi:hypothetical protein
MENDGPMKYWNSTPRQVEDIYCDLQEKYADEYRNRITAAFEREAKVLAETTNPYERERLQAMHDVTAEYIRNGRLDDDANDHGFNMVVEKNPELHAVAWAMMCKAEYEFQSGKLFEEKMQETRALTKSFEAECDRAGRELADHQSKKPSMLENVATFGRTGKAWRSGEKTLRLSAGHAENRRQEQVAYAASPLAAADARAYAAERMEKDYSGMAEDYRQVEQLRIEHGIRYAPVQTYEGEVRKYAVDYPLRLGREIAAAGEVLAARKACLEEHEKAKPGLVRNVLSLGRLSGEWSAARDSLAGGVAAAETEMGELKDSRWNNRNGDTPDALAWAENTVKETYPDLAEAYQAGIAAEWQAKNRERLEKVPERSSENSMGKSVER